MQCGDGKRLQDAQGNLIPTLGKRDIDIYFTDVGGRRVCLRERVTISDRVSQPILCFAKLLENGWSINSKSQTLVHEGSNIQIPIDMQNTSLVVQGHIRMVQEDPLEIRLMKATVDASLLGHEYGWRMNDKGHIIGFHISNKFTDPLDYNQQFYDVYRTTLCQDEDGQWQLVEICEKIDSLIYLDNDFERPGMRNVLTILTENSTIPEDMGFSLEGELDMEGLRAAAAQHEAVAMEQVDQRDGIAFAPEDIADEVVQLSMDVEEKMDKVVIEEFNPSSLVVNRIEPDRSGSSSCCLQFLWFVNVGSKKKCYGRLLTYMKQVELETAREAMQAAERIHHRDPQPIPKPECPTAAEVERHNLTHTPCQNWCPHCMTRRRIKGNCNPYN